MTAATRTHYLADHARVAPMLAGAGIAWLTRQRQHALETFARDGLPTRHDEAWRHTSVTDFEANAFHAATTAPNIDAQAKALFDRLTLDKDAAHLLVFHDGHFSPSLSSPGKLPDDVTLQSLAHVLATSPDLAKPWLASMPTVSAFESLNEAFMADGAYLHLKKNVVLKNPVHLMFIATTAGQASYLRNLIVAESGAQATVIEHYVGAPDTLYFTSTMTGIFTQEGASVSHHKLQQESQAAFHMAGLHAVQQRDSRLASHSFTLGGQLTRNDIRTVFDGLACEATLNGLYLVGGDQHVDNHTLIDHQQPQGTSQERYRGILEDRSHAVFTGKIIVQPGAQKTNANQSNHNLLLSNNAEIDTQPQLEIYADDVKCTHGATVGQLDETQLFYLRSRGIDEAQARRLLVQAFAHDVIEPIRVAALRARLETLLLSHLPASELVGEPS